MGENDKQKELGMKKLFSTVGVVVLALGLLSGCKKESTPDEYNKMASQPELLHKSAHQLTDVIVYDIFKPPVASRIYAYSFLAATMLIKNTE